MLINEHSRWTVVYAHSGARKACGGLYSLAGGEKSDDFSNFAEPTFRSLAAAGAWEPFLRSRLLGEDVAEFDPGAPDEVARGCRCGASSASPRSLELRAAAMMRRQRRIIIVSDGGASLLHWLRHHTNPQHDPGLVMRLTPRRTRTAHTARA